FEFMPLDEVVDEPRPAPYEGWRTRVALQVDRAIYDKILLDHARECGVEVREQTTVREVRTSAGRVEGLVLEGGEEITARHYVDASGNSGILRRQIPVPLDIPPALKNVAFWDYWENADWAVEIGVGGTRIQIMSLSWGWMWFIPLGPTRTSIGLVTPAKHAKASGLSPEELYRKALAEEPRIRALIQNAQPEGRVRATKDWSFAATKCAGENWFLVGECAGFADPILSAGMTLAQVGARELACTIAALEEGELDSDWLRGSYCQAQRDRVWQHIRFATFWYTGNGRFTELFAETQRIARDAGYEMDANEAFRWFASGSFTGDAPTATLANHGMATAKYIAQLMTRQTIEWEVARHNRFFLDVDEHERIHAAEYREGQVRPVRAFKRGEKTLRLTNVNELVVKAIEAQPDVTEAFRLLESHFARFTQDPQEIQERLFRCIEALEALVLEGWVVGRTDPKRPFLKMTTPTEPGPYIHPNQDVIPAEATAK
ncbi:MAG: tryptophan 7-halogenase, partial [Fimbriimonadaceae bacterium]|nr:tryptophan 7-halogenase [Fimbriimonadaceae bacterium]